MIIHVLNYQNTFPLFKIVLLEFHTAWSLSHIIFLSPDLSRCSNTSSSSPSYAFCLLKRSLPETMAPGGSEPQQKPGTWVPEITPVWLQGHRPGANPRWPPVWHHTGLGAGQAVAEMAPACGFNAWAGDRIPETTTEMIPDTQRPQGSTTRWK